MNYFLNCIEAKFVGVYQSRPIIRLTQPLYFFHDTWGTITVPRGMDCDIASVPRVPIAFYLWGDRAHRAAVLHDFGYRKGSSPDLSRKQVDDLFYDAMRATGESLFIAATMFEGVRIGGSAAFHKLDVFERFPPSCYYFKDVVPPTGKV